MVDLQAKNLKLVDRGERIVMEVGGVSREEARTAIAGAKGSVKLDYTPPKYESDRATGCIVDVDRFGNCITDVEHARLGFEPRQLRVCGVSITRSSTNYAEAGRSAFMIVGSSGCYEISVANQSAAKVLQLARFDVVTIQ